MIELQGVFDKVLTIVQEVEAKVPEEEGKEKYTGEEKKALAVTAINAVIDIPMLPEFVEGKIFGSVVGLLIEFAVYIHNKLDLFVAEKKAAKSAKAVKAG